MDNLIIGVQLADILTRHFGHPRGFFASIQLVQLRTMSLHCNLWFRMLHTCIFLLIVVVYAESIGGVVYSNASDRAEKQRASQTGEADHLPITTQTNQKELTAVSRPPVYTSSERPGEKWLDQHPQLTTITSSPPVYSNENPGEKGLDEQLWLTTQTPTSQPTTATPTISGIG